MFREELESSAVARERILILYKEQRKGGQWRGAETISVSQ